MTEIINNLNNLGWCKCIHIELQNAEKLLYIY